MSKITIDSSVVKQALEALFMYKPMVTGVTFQHGLDAMQALRAALDQQQVEQEPVAEITGMDEYGPMLGWHKHWAEFPVGTKLHTHPQPPRQPLTDQQIHDCFQHRHRDEATERRMITRAIEFAHGITGEQE